MRILKYRKTDRPRAVNRKRHADNAERVKLHVTKGDTVRVMRGDDKGKEGKVHPRLPKTGRVTVEGVNIVKKHRKARTAEEQSGIVEMPAPIHASNVMLLDPKTGEPTRTRRRIDDGRHQGTHQRQERGSDSRASAEREDHENDGKDEDKKKARRRARAPGAKGAKQKKGGEAEGRAVRTPAPSCRCRRRASSEFYEQTVRPKLTEQFGFTNPHQIPTLEKIVLNVGVGEAIKQPKAARLGRRGAGDRSPASSPVRKKAKKSIANFGLREGQEIGAAVTLRGARMWEFLDRFITVAIPRIRDFRGLSTQSFDGRGNYSLGIKEQMIFPEINYDMIESIHGMDITFVTTHEPRRSRVRAAEGAGHAVPDGREEGRQEAGSVRRDQRRVNHESPSQ